MIAVYIFPKKTPVLLTVQYKVYKVLLMEGGKQLA